MIANEGQYFKKTGKTLQLSVEQLIECDSSVDEAAHYADCGMFGGWPYLAYGYFMRAGGIHTEEDFPYCSGIPLGETGGCLPCMASGYNTKLCGDHSDLYCKPQDTKGQSTGGYCETNTGFLTSLKSWKAISKNETAIAEALVEYGPLSVTLNAEALQFYFGGVYNPLFCNPDELDHAVPLVGYGKDLLTDYWV